MAVAWARFQHDQRIAALGERAVPLRGVMLDPDGSERSGRVHEFPRVHEPANDFDGTGMARCGAYADPPYRWDATDAVQSRPVDCSKCVPESSITRA